MAAELQRREIAVELAEIAGDSRSVGAEPDQAVALGDRQHWQIAEIGRGERLGVRRVDQRTGEVVGPAVVRADQRLRRARRIDQPGRAMPARVGQTADHAVATAGQDQRRAGHVDRHAHPGVQRRRRGDHPRRTMPRAGPYAPERRRALAIEPRVRQVVLGGDTERRPRRDSRPPRDAARCQRAAGRRIRPQLLDQSPMRGALHGSHLVYEIIISHAR